MTLTEILQKLFTELGVDWVLILLILLSFISIAIIIEKFIFFKKREVDFTAVKTSLLEKRDISSAPKGSMEREVFTEVLREMDRLPDTEIEGLASSKIGEMRVSYKKRLDFLGTIGSNAPYIGLFGTVVGIMAGFYELKELLTTGSKTELIMIRLSEALVATAIGLLVAIPAVMAYNYFMMKIKKAEERTYAMVDLIPVVRKNEKAKTSAQ
jgi:biopolymer transport protein ExbB